MNTITQTMRFWQALVAYSYKHGVTQAAVRYKTNRPAKTQNCPQADPSVHPKAARLNVLAARITNTSMPHICFIRLTILQ